MRPLIAIQPLSKPSIDEPIPGLEEAIAAYEAEGREESAHVAACLRKMPPGWAARLLLIREAAKTTRRWQADQSEPFRGAHSDGLHEERIEFVEPDVHSKASGGKPFSCATCGGVRFLRMTNHHPGPVEVETENARVTHRYEPAESYLVPCDKCSARRRDQYRNRKPLRGRDETVDRRKPKAMPDEED